MKVLLISATMNAEFSYMRKFLGLGYIHAHALADPDIARDVELHHRFHDTHEHSCQHIAREILAEEPDLVAFAAYTWNIGTVLELCRLLKREAPAVRTLLGGPEVSYHARRYLEENPAVDWICVGEGEITFRELLRHMLRHRDDPPGDVAGMAFRAASGIDSAPPRPYLTELDRLESPFLSGVLEVDPLLHSAYFQTTRGCPFTCTYCDYGRNQPYYEFSMPRVREELRYFQRHGTRALFAVDATFNYRRGRANEILRLVLEEGLDTQFSIELFPSLIDAELLTLIEQLPSAHVGVGIQTAHLEAMRNVRRIWVPSRAAGMIERLAQMPHVDLSLELIMGLPGDDLSSFYQTLDWSHDRGPQHIFCMPLQILPRTPLERQVEQFSIEHTGPEQGNEIVSCDSFSAEEVTVGKAICLFNRQLQPLVFRLRRLLDLRPSEFLERWSRRLHEAGLYPQVTELHFEVEQPPRLTALLDRFEEIVREFEEERDARGVARPLRELLHMILLRRALSRHGVFLSQALDLAGMTVRREDLRLHDLDPEAPSLGPHEVPSRTEPAREVVFEYDLEQVHACLDRAAMTRLEPTPTRYWLYRHPDSGGGQGVRLDATQTALLRLVDGRRSVDRIARLAQQQGLHEADRLPWLLGSLHQLGVLESGNSRRPLSPASTAHAHG